MTIFDDKLGTTISIRPMSDSDYDAAVRVSNAVWPDYPSTVEEMRYRDGSQDPKIKWGRFVAEVDGVVVGLANYGQSLGMYHPRKFHVDIDVLPEFERRGIGSALYETLIGALAPLEASVIRTHAREDLTDGTRFLQERGFVEEMREWESRLDVASFQGEAFAEKAEAVRSSGIEIRSLAALADDPDRDRKHYEMHWQIVRDIPAPDEITQPTFEQFQKRLIGNPNFLPEGYFVAIDGDRFVGESALWKSQADAGLHVGTTGVLREYRRRNIAFALKLRAIEYAQSVGCPEIKTWNAQTNVGMLAINGAIGFVRQPAWISFAKNLDLK